MSHRTNKAVCFSAGLLAVAALGATAAPGWQFDFSGGAAPAGFVAVAPANLYNETTGFGFEPGTGAIAGNGCVTGGQPFSFSAKVPEGNYRVTAKFGDQTAPAKTTVKAELRRLMIEGISTQPGEFATRSFLVNVRTPRIGATGEVRLKPREKTSEWIDWDDKLTLEFNGDRPCLASLSIAPVEAPTVYLLGDSTVADQPNEPWNSWGQMLPRFFKPEVAVANHAESGESISSSLSARRFEKVFRAMKPGDYLFIQFGHNDMKSHATNALKKFGDDLRRVVATTRARGGTPVLVTPMERMAGVDHPTLDGYPDTIRQAAAEEHCALIDLNKMSLTLYNALGPDLKKAFQDGTHHNTFGSYEVAKCVAQGIRRAKLPLAGALSDDFTGFDPLHPDSPDAFHVPASLHRDDAKPAGN